MRVTPCNLAPLVSAAALFVWLRLETVLAADPAATLQDQFQQLKQQNDLLERQMQQQQTVIESLSRRVSTLEQARGGPSLMVAPASSSRMTDPASAPKI